jgi:hypothetical protein
LWSAWPAAAETPVGDLVQENVVLGPGTHEVDRDSAGAEIVPGAVEHPRTERVEAVDAGEVDEAAAALLGGAHQLVDLLLDALGMLDGPAAGQRRPDLVSERLEFRAGLVRCRVLPQSGPSLGTMEGR